MRLALTTSALIPGGVQKASSEGAAKGLGGQVFGRAFYSVLAISSHLLTWLTSGVCGLRGKQGNGNCCGHRVCCSVTQGAHLARPAGVSVPPPAPTAHGTAIPWARGSKSSPRVACFWLRRLPVKVSSRGLSASCCSETWRALCGLGAVDHPGLGAEGRGVNVSLPPESPSLRQAHHHDLRREERRSL